MDTITKIEDLRKYGVYIELYRSHRLPVLICNEKLEVCWANPAMETAYPGCADQEGFDRLIREFDKNGIMEDLRAGKPVWFGNLIGLSEIMLGITPVIKGADLYGAVAELIGEKGLKFPADKQSSRIPMQIESNIRENVAGILNEILSAQREADLEQTGLGSLEKRFSKITLNSYNLLRVASNISEYAGMNIEMKKPVPVMVDLFALISATSGKVRELAEDMGIPVNYSFPDTEDGLDAIIGIDVDMFESAFFEILHNALYFTKEGNYVEIKGGFGKGHVSVTVSDHGVGIAAENLPHADAPYFACGHGSCRAGIGLGLTIAKAKIEAMDGSLKIKSRAGVGTEVTLTFKRKKVKDIVTRLYSTDKYTILDRFSHLYVNLVDAKMSRYNPQNNW